MRIPDVVETLTVLAACEQFMKLNEADDATTSILLSMTATILNTSDDHVLQLIEDNKAKIDIINS